MKKNNQQPGTPALSATSNQLEILLLKTQLIRNLRDLQKLIQQDVSQLLHFDTISIHMIGKDEQTHLNYLYYAHRAPKGDTGFSELKKSTFTSGDGFFDVTLEADSPIIWDLAEVVKRQNIPAYITYSLSEKISVIAGVPLIDKNRRSGVLFMGFEKADKITTAEISRISEFGNSLSIAIANIQDVGQETKISTDQDALLTLFEAAGQIKNKSSLSTLFNIVLKRIIDFNAAAVLMKDADQLLPFYNDTENLIPFMPLKTGFRQDLLYDVLLNGEAAVWSPDDFLQRGERPQLTNLCLLNNWKRILCIPLKDFPEIKGVLLLFSGNTHFDNVSLSILNRLSHPVRVAVTLIQSAENLTERENELAAISTLTVKLTNISAPPDLPLILKEAFSAVNFFEEGVIYLPDRGRQTYRPQLFKQRADAIFTGDYLPHQADSKNTDNLPEFIQQLQQAAILDEPILSAMKSTSRQIRKWLYNGLTAMACIKLMNGNTLQGYLLFLTGENPARLQQSAGLLHTIASQLSLATHRFYPHPSLPHAEADSVVQPDHFPDSLSSAHGMTGASAEMKKIFHLINQVAGTDTSVLILGETGTGKELVAQGIHNASARARRTMIKVNCAILPQNLIESELFGHEQGSFTGATSRKIGKFESADKSTILLDEIGELSIDLQAKLLRVIQEKEIERIGGKRTIKIDVRIIAATNRDLAGEVDAGRFRSDLYFRLNVFPVTLPPLRDHKSDIPLLAAYFSDKYTKKFSLPRKRFSQAVLKQLMAYNWPGNIRQLEHLIERHILLNKGKLISEIRTSDDTPGEQQTKATPPIKTIDELTREHILTVLKMTNGKVSGVGGAAELLRIPSTTLNSKIIKLKIKKGLSE